MIDNPDLDHLESLLAQFNLFEALGAVRQELRHSDFLAFLLNPQQSHGLGDAFVKRLLQRVIAAAEPSPAGLTRLELDLWDLSELEVRREWRNIDLLLLSETHRLAVVIENKIDSGEHSHQIQRYRQLLHQAYPGWRTIFVLLTPEGAIPSDSAYLSLDYAAIAELIDRLLQVHQSTLGQEIATLMAHYAQMVRRHIVTESEIADLCRRIYRKHQRALDLIYEYRPDLQGQLYALLEELIPTHAGLILDGSTKSAIRFAPLAWDEHAVQHQGSGWTASHRLLLFEWRNVPNQLKLSLHLGPGPAAIREQIYAFAATHKPPFSTAYKSAGPKWRTIYHRSVLVAANYEEASFADLEAKVRSEWKQFCNNDLPTLVETVQQCLARLSVSSE
ncbi:MAG TPA: PD-(D/E)XK nuclease family protein [Caldilineaceae bacterium]|nr:PD-(D/E)XK nuclease family protein [Caldilineaceae bacterium]